MASTSGTGNSPSLQVPPNSPTASLAVNPPSSETRSPPVLHHESKQPVDYSSESFDPKDEKLVEERSANFIRDPAGALTHDETTVDIVTVPCPGGDPLKSWNRDGLLGRYFGNPSMRDAEIDQQPSNAPSWVRQGIRREADVARVLLYEHPEVVDGTNFGGLADALLQNLRIVRDEDGEEDKQRPIIFVAHSLGGLVVKMALAKAANDTSYGDILRDCYGVAFFGTPHQGSSYFAMPSLSASIQSILQLAKPLPTSITDDLRVGNPVLLRADEAFKAIAHDLRVWTLYETIDSRLCGPNSTDQKNDKVYFTAPLTSIKSAILGMRQERIFPLQSDHANVASFGRHNAHTLRLFLRQLGGLIGRADASVRRDMEDGGARWLLNLEQKVNVEVHGFFEDATIDDDPVVRAWSTRLPLTDFLRKGPDECLSDRLHEVEDIPEEHQFLRPREGLGIKNQLLNPTSSPPVSPVLRPADSPRHPRIRRISSPPMPTTARRISTPSRYSTPMRRPSPLIRADFDQDLAVDRLSPPSRPRSIMSIGRSVSDQSSKYEYRDFPPFSQQRSRSTTGDHGAVVDDDDIESSPPLPEAVVAIRKSVKDGQRRTSEVVVDEVPVAFARPDVNDRKFVWVHLPYNNPTWVKNIFETLQVSYKRDYSALFGNEFWASKHTKGRHSQHYAYFAKPGCYFAALRTFSPKSRSISPISSLNAQDAASLCLFLPYLHFDSYKRLIRRRDLILERLTRGRARPVPENVAKSDSMETQVIWEFLGHDPPINCRRTLDQFGYPSLRDTRGRDDDQMLYKLTKERDCRYGEHRRDLYAHSLNSRSASYGSHGSWKERLTGLEREQEAETEDDGVRNGNVLMVDQLWLWVVHGDTLLSFFPKRESDPIEGPLYQQADLRDSIFNEVNVDLTRQCGNALDLAALSALHAVSVLLDGASHPDLEVFRIFDEAISVLTEKLTNSLKTFRIEGFKDKASSYTPVENKEGSIRARHKEEGRRAEQENRDNTSALLELRDLEDELLVLLQLFDRQYAVLSSMLTAYSSPVLRERTHHGRGFINEAIRLVSGYKQRAMDMADRVRSTRDDYDKLLQMVQRQSQVDEVRLSRLHADLASAQSRSVMIFTVFTVIFLPLTFFTGLFGMNTKEWEGEGMPTLGFIGAISLPASAGLIIISLVTAFSTRVRRLFLLLKEFTLETVSWSYDATLEPTVERYRQRQAAKRKSSKKVKKTAEERRGVKKELSDFWERHRLERERGYQIPEVNRKRGGEGVRKKGSGKGKKETDSRLT